MWQRHAVLTLQDRHLAAGPICSKCHGVLGAAGAMLAACCCSQGGCPGDDVALGQRCRAAPVPMSRSTIPAQPSTTTAPLGVSLLVTSIGCPSL